MFAIVATPYDAYQSLPGRLFKLQVALSRYADRAGTCFPTVRQLAGDVLESIATTWRDLNKLEEHGCFTRKRQGRGRFFYKIAEAYRPRWPERVSPKMKHGVSQAETQEAYPSKHKGKVRENFGVQEVDWAIRMRGWHHPQAGRPPFWLDNWGPRPGEPGCFVPAELLHA